jgi:hypothetical protein
MMKQILANQAKSDAEMEAERKADKEMLAEIKAERKANHEEMMAMIKAWRQTGTKDNGEETMACEEKTEVRLEEEEEPTSVEMKPEVADDQEVPVEDAEVRSVGEPRKRRRDGRNLAAVRRQKKKERNLDAGRHGKQRNSVAARRGATRRAAMARRRILLTETTRSRLIVAVRKVSRRATVARRRRDATKKERDNARRASGERTPKKRRRVGTKGNTARKDPDARRQLRLRNVKTAGRLCRGNHEDVIGPKIAKRTARTPARIRTTKDWTLWRGRPPP